MIVLDASAVVELLLGGERARPVVERLDELGGGWQVPGHLDLEAAQVFRRWEAAGHLTPARASAGLELLSELPLRRHGVDSLMGRVWELRANLTAYDAAYVALAEGLDAPLLTRDERIGRAPGHQARVVVV